MDDITAGLPEPADASAGVPSPVRPRRPRLQRHLRLVLGAAAAAVIVGVPSSLALYAHLAAGAPDVVDRMVPSDADVYATAYLDPSLSQKLNLQGLIGHLPGISSSSQLESRIDQVMDMALEPEGLSFAKDVRPWLGTQVAVAMRLGSGTPTTVLIASTDDSTAEAALARIRTTNTGARDSWSDQQHGGIAVSVGTPSASGGAQMAYAYVDHTAVVGNSAAMIEEVIDTDQGRHEALRTASAYTGVLQRLPSDRLGLAYVNGAAIASAVGQQLGSSGLGGAGQLKLFDQAAGVLKSIGLAVSAQSNGIATDLAIDADTSKLTPAERQAVAGATATTAANPTLSWIPDDAAGFLALGGLGNGLQSFLDQTGTSPTEASAQTGNPLSGLFDPHGVLSHLTGEVAVEVRTSSTSAIPGGAVLAGTDDATAVQSFLDGIARADAGSKAPSTQSDRGTTITSVPIPFLDGLGIDPAYAVVDGMTVIGTNPAQVRAVLDAHASGSPITALPKFTAAGAYSASDPILYLDLDRVRAAVEKVLPARVARTYDKDVQPDLEHLHALRITAQGVGDQVTDRIFLDIG